MIPNQTIRMRMTLGSGTLVVAPQIYRVSNSPRKQTKTLARLAVLFSLTSLNACSTLKGWIMGDDTPATTRAPASIGDNTSNGEQEVLKAVNALPEYQGSPVGPDLQKNEFAQATRLYNERSQQGFRGKADPWDGAGSGNENSLWNGESQENFLFTRNLKYKAGDFVILTVEPDMSESLNARIATLYQPTHKATRTVVAEEAGKAAGAKVGDAVAKQVKNSNIGTAVGQDIAASATELLNGKGRYFTTREVPLRITEVTNNGQLRVAGNKMLFLKSANYNLNISGVIREDDISPSRTIASSRLMESKVDLTK